MPHFLSLLQLVIFFVSKNDFQQPPENKAVYERAKILTEQEALPWLKIQDIFFLWL